MKALAPYFSRMSRGFRKYRSMLSGLDDSSTRKTLAVSHLIFLGVVLTFLGAALPHLLILLFGLAVLALTFYWLGEESDASSGEPEDSPESGEPDPELQT